MVIAQVKIRAHPCESNMFHGCCKMDWIMFVPTWCPKHISELQLHTSEDFEHVSFGKVREVCVLSCNVLNVLECRVVWTMSQRANSVDYPQLFFKCKLSKSRHLAEYREKHVAFVEELWSFKQSSRSTNILTSEFNLCCLYHTSPTPTHYCIDV